MLEQTEQLLTEEQKQELVRVYGPAVRSAVEPVAALFRHMLEAKDIFGVVFLSESIAVTVLSAMAEARLQQRERSELH